MIPIFSNRPRTGSASSVESSKGYYGRFGVWRKQHKTLGRSGRPYLDKTASKSGVNYMSLLYLAIGIVVIGLWGAWLVKSLGGWFGGSPVVRQGPDIHVTLSPDQVPGGGGNQIIWNTPVPGP